MRPLQNIATHRRAGLIPAAWAAVEAFLSHPDDPQEVERSGKAVAADRLAAIIACSWPRAELTALAHRHKPQQADALSERLAACRTNLDRASCLSDVLRVSGVNVFDFSGACTKHSDRPAAERMAALLADPRRVPNEVMGTYRIALRPPYRTRNIVLHGGATQGAALRLVGAETGLPVVQLLEPA